MVLDEKNIPKGYHALNPFVIIKGDAAKFIEFVEKVYGGRERTYLRTPDKDGSLIHAEVQIGDATLLIADSKSDWPFTPGFLQVYVTNAQATLDCAKEMGATVVTEVSMFYGGFKLARLKDPWGNIWWLYEPETDEQESAKGAHADASWHDRKPSYIYTTLIDAMRDLKAGRSA
jgi:uncharacterized glyoxalase superfamily protein PhnB